MSITAKEIFGSIKEGKASSSIELVKKKASEIFENEKKELVADILIEKGMKKKMDEEDDKELKGDQDELDVDGDGDIEADDLKDLRDKKKEESKDDM